MLKTFTLKNGIKVATYSIPNMYSVYISIFVKAGSIFDKRETSGEAHYMEHILVEGIPSYPNVEALSDFIESIAGSYNAYTSSQLVSFVINGPAKQNKEMLRIASEVFFEPLFPADGVEREREAISSEVRGKMDSINYKLGRFWSDHRFQDPNHPLRLRGEITLAALAKLQREDLIGYWQRFFSTKNTYLVVVGGFKDNEVKKTVEQLFGKFKPGKEFEGYPNLSNKDYGDRGVFINFDPELKSCYMDLNFPSISMQNTYKELIVQMIARRILGSSVSSRLHRLLRQRMGLVYNSSFSASAYATFGDASISSEMSIQNLDQVLELTIKELDNFIKTGPTKEELQSAKDFLANRSAMSFDSPRSIAGWVEDDLVWNGRHYSLEDYIKLLKSVTSEDIMELMKKYWDFSKLNLTIQGPIKNSKANIKKYQKMIAGLK